MHRAIGRFRYSLKRTGNKAIAADTPANEWKHYVKVGLQGHRARDEADLQARKRSFQLDPAHATAYCRHIAFIEGVRIFVN
jgi:hypothetical protein